MNGAAMSFQKVMNENNVEEGDQNRRSLIGWFRDDFHIKASLVQTPGLGESKAL